MRKTKGKIFINEIAADCIIGVSKQERSKKQEILISLQLEFDMQSAIISDTIEDTVNYRTIYQDVIMLVEQSEFHLLETLAGRIAHTCLAYSGVSLVVVKVTKPKVLKHAKGVTIEITMTNE